MILFFVSQSTKGNKPIVEVAVFKGDFFITAHLHFINKALKFCLHLYEMGKHLFDLIDHKFAFIFKRDLPEICNLGATAPYHLQGAFPCALFKINLSHNCFQESCFATAVSADYRNFFTVVDFKIYVFKHHIAIVRYSAVDYFVLHIISFGKCLSKIHL